MLNRSLQRRTPTSFFARTCAGGPRCALDSKSCFGAPTTCRIHTKPLACSTKTSRCRETVYSRSEDHFGNYTSEQTYDIGFTGREWDADIGLYNYRARWYNPELGKFISEDPAGFAAGDPNLYGYVGNDPLNLVDPSGLAAILPNAHRPPSSNYIDVNSIPTLGSVPGAQIDTGSLAYSLGPSPTPSTPAQSSPTLLSELGSSRESIQYSQSGPIGEDVTAAHFISIGRDMANGKIIGGSYTSGQRALIDHGYGLAMQDQSNGLVVRSGFNDEFGWHRSFCMSCHDPTNRNSQLKMGAAVNTLNSSWSAFLTMEGSSMAVGGALGRLASTGRSVANTTRRVSTYAPNPILENIGRGYGLAAEASQKAVTSRGMANAASGARLRAYLAQQEILGARATGSALKGGGLEKSANTFSPRTFGRNLDVDHRAAPFFQDIVNEGQHFTVRGTDGISRNLTQLPATVNGRHGIVEFLVGPKGLEHQRFIPGGRITGTVNQVPKKLP